MIGHKLTIESDGTPHGTKATLDGREISLIAGQLEFYHEADASPYLRFVTHPRTNPPLPNLLEEDGRCVRLGDRISIEFGRKDSMRST